MSDPADEARLAEIATAVQMFAALRFDARAPIDGRGDVVEALATSVNFLGEELTASFADLERRLADATAQLGASTLTDRPALVDPLTGLSNRYLAEERIGHRIDTAGRRPSHFAVLMIDLDGFADLAARLGPRASDRVLIEAGSRIRSLLRRGDTAARVAADEFLLLLDEVDDSESVETLAQRLADALRLPIDADGERVSLSAGVGIVVSAEPPGSVEELVTSAQAALAEAKRNGPDSRVLYNGLRHGGGEGS
ncbi:MAG TPA: diguanylate cyclase [Acidimicrobiales bacterium]|nr:diguanylate cyclase [Acidimicrobiales bacterium]